MDREQIALELTLKLFEKGKIIIAPPSRPLMPDDITEYNHKSAEQLLDVYNHLLSIQ